MLFIPFERGNDIYYFFFFGERSQIKKIKKTKQIKLKAKTYVQKKKELLQLCDFKAQA